MEELLQSLTSTAAEAVTETTATPDTLEGQAWAVADLALDSGFAEGMALTLGAPFVVVLGIRVLKRWRKEQRGQR